MFFHCHAGQQTHPGFSSEKDVCDSNLLNVGPVVLLVFKRGGVDKSMLRTDRTL